MNEIAPELRLRFYETMLRIRRFEEETGALFAAGELPGFVHLSIGQEAVPTGVCSALGVRDTITATKGMPDDELKALALASEKVQRSIGGAAIRKVIVVPDRLVNIVA